MSRDIYWFYIKERINDQTSICSAGVTGNTTYLGFGRKRLFVFALTNVQFDLTKRKMSSNGSANVKQSEIIIR